MRTIEIHIRSEKINFCLQKKKKKKKVGAGLAPVERCAENIELFYQAETRSVENKS